MSDQGHCHALLAQLSEYVEGCLSNELCADLERHLSECEDCTIVVNTLRRTIELYHKEAKESETLPENVRERLFSRLNLDDYLKS